MVDQPSEVGGIDDLCDGECDAAGFSNAFSLARDENKDASIKAKPQHSQSEFYHYDRLNTRKDVIRVLDVHAGPDESAIRCTMRQESLGSRHECLSYTWGSGAADHIIYINEKPFLVRQNLWHFLWYARRRAWKTSMWVDAICINQSSADERSHQVGRMAFIYWKASKVHVWLGCASPAVRTIFSSFSLFGALQTLRNPEFLVKGASWSDGIQPQLELVLSLKYWSRVWVVQELCLAQQAELIYAGYKISWLEFTKLLDFLESELRLRNGHVSQSVLEDYSTSGLRNIFLNFLRTNEDDIPKADIFDLLATFKLHRCRDPRDRVYSLLGMADGYHTLTPDYKELGHLLFLRTLYAFPQRSRSRLLVGMQDLVKALEVHPKSINSVLQPLLTRPPHRSAPGSSDCQSYIYEQVASTCQGQQIDFERTPFNLSSTELCESCLATVLEDRGWFIASGSSRSRDTDEAFDQDPLRQLDWSRVDWCSDISTDPNRVHTIRLSEITYPFHQARLRISTTDDFVDVVEVGEIGQHERSARTIKDFLQASHIAVKITNNANSIRKFKEMEIALKVLLPCSYPEWCSISDPPPTEVLPGVLSSAEYLMLEKHLRNAWIGKTKKLLSPPSPWLRVRDKLYDALSNRLERT